ncbi:hypothetical protein SLEP1_g12784 [Rubroshorea leprosula]|uniref:Acyl carrier protein n=1 Tax=Rubroshorea leprosula TaxID=152421 RepID=A0AAV5IDL4_9ROSI|nr:hypothetical protein SLEP1_g12784 [Rubroshorea leprosula]
MGGDSLHTVDFVSFCLNLERIEVDLASAKYQQVEIMMALEEQFGVSIGEGGAEDIATVQDAADLIEKVKAEEA